MKPYLIYLSTIAILFSILCCNSETPLNKEDKRGSYTGLFSYGNFQDTITFELSADSTRWEVYFTSLQQGAMRIPARQVRLENDSLWFTLQSDRYTYSFENKWSALSDSLYGTLSVDTTVAAYALARVTTSRESNITSEEVTFNSSGLKLHGTIWRSKMSRDKAVIIITSSGNANRSASRAEAMFYASLGYVSFHYDKRGTGNSEGAWTTATMEELVADDINAIKFFSGKTGISLKHTGIAGSSQGGAKIPYVLSGLPEIKYGIVVSCPGSSLLESDLNYWKNNNAEKLGKALNEALTAQKLVFQYIAGLQDRSTLEEAVSQWQSKAWYSQIWVPDLDEIQTDSKLAYSPLPYFEQVQQPILIIQGGSDEIIPGNSQQLISAALDRANNKEYHNILLENASHAMAYIGPSDFPYWTRTHPGYYQILRNWLIDVNSKGNDQ